MQCVVVFTVILLVKFIKDFSVIFITNHLRNTVYSDWSVECAIKPAKNFTLNSCNKFLFHINFKNFAKNKSTYITKYTPK